MILGEMEKGREKWKESNILMCLIGEENGKDSHWGFSVLFSPRHTKMLPPNLRWKLKRKWEQNGLA